MDNNQTNEIIRDQETIRSTFEHLDQDSQAGHGNSPVQSKSFSEPLSRSGSWKMPWDFNNTMIAEPLQSREDTACTQELSQYDAAAATPPTSTTANNPAAAFDSLGGAINSTNINQTVASSEDTKPVPRVPSRRWSFSRNRAAPNLGSQDSLERTNSGSKDSARSTGSMEEPAAAFASASGAVQETFADQQDSTTPAGSSSSSGGRIAAEAAAAVQLPSNLVVPAVSDTQVAVTPAAAAQQSAAAAPTAASASASAPAAVELVPASSVADAADANVDASLQQHKGKGKARSKAQSSSRSNSSTDSTSGGGLPLPAVLAIGLAAAAAVAGAVVWWLKRAGKTAGQPAEEDEFEREMRRMEAEEKALEAEEKAAQKADKKAAKAAKQAPPAEDAGEAAAGWCNGRE